MPNTPADKRAVFSGIITAWVLSSGVLGLGGWLSYSQGVFSGIGPQKLLALTLILPALSLAMGIGWAARTRHFIQNIDGSRPEDNSPLDITLRYVQNTTEQLVLFTLMAICFLGALPSWAQVMLPILGLWFFIARLLFWTGYRRAGLGRAVGFASTFHPTFVFLLMSLAALMIA